METTSSTSSCERPISSWGAKSTAPLLGCGVDLERVARFARYVDPHAEVWPLIFSERELDHARRLPKPAEALCAAFCVKEAFTKALDAPFEYTDCELLLDPEAERQQVIVAEPLARTHGIVSSEARIEWPPSGECLAVVYVYGDPP